LIDTVLDRVFECPASHTEIMEILTSKA